MKALLLAAGLGTRLRPITDTIPKCLVLINGKPLLEIWLERLLNIGVNEFLINTHYLHEEVEKFVLNSPYKDKITLVYEEKLLGTGGSILKNKDFFNGFDSFWVIHADNYSICDYNQFRKSHYTKPKNTIMTMMTFSTDSPKSCGIVELDKQGIVIGFYEKVHNPPSNLANGAVYIFDKEILVLLESLNKEIIDLSTEVLPKMLGKIYTFHNNKIHIDIGTVKNLEIANHIACCEGSCFEK
ncbi:MAG: nucleotidyltransferase family protein [Arcobacteraceae bacterium]